jgi:hypothetical protein
VEYTKENMDVWGFELSAAEMATLSGLQVRRTPRPLA